MSKIKFSNLLFIFFLSLSLNACNEHWWTRGQAPSPDDLLKRAQNRISEIKEEYQDKRPEISKVAESIVSETITLNSADLKRENIEIILINLEKSFASLEGQLSYGNRAPFGELSGQIRAMKNDSKNSAVSNEAFTLFMARVLFFLSSEMKVPAPDPIATS